MPDYTVQAPDGQTIKFHSDEELDDAHAATIAQHALGQNAQKSSPVAAPPGALETAGEHAAVGIGPGAAFAAAAPQGARLGAMAGAAIPGLGETGIPEIVGGVIGALATGGIASWAAYKAQHAILKSTAPKFTEEMDKRLATGEDAHPFAAVVGDVAGNLPSMEMEAPKLAQLPFRAALGGTVGAVLPLAQGRKPTLKDVGEGALMGTVLGKSRFESAKLATRAGIHPADHEILEKSAGVLPVATAEVAKTKLEEGAKSNEPENPKDQMLQRRADGSVENQGEQGNLAKPGGTSGTPVAETAKVPPGVNPDPIVAPNETQHAPPGVAPPVQEAAKTPVSSPEAKPAPEPAGATVQPPKQERISPEFLALAKKAGYSTKDEVQRFAQQIRHNAEARKNFPEAAAALDAPQKPRVGKGVGRFKSIEKLRAEAGSPPDAIDHFQQEVGGKIKLSDATAIHEDFKANNRSLRSVFDEDGKVPLDKAAQAMERLGYKGDEDLLEKLRSAAEARDQMWQKHVKNAPEPKPFHQQQYEDWVDSTKKGGQEVIVDDTLVGDILDVDGTKATVTAIDPETGNVTVEDGRRFGIQTLPAGGKVFVESHITEKGEPIPPKKPTTPKLGSMEKGTGDLLKGQSEDFGLTGDKGTDFERIQAAKAKSEADKKESEKGQSGLIGMGGAVPSEFEGGSGTPTGIKNATVDLERSRRGLPPAIQPLRRSFGEVWDRAMAHIDNDPGWLDGDKERAGLIKDLREQPRALTDEEDAALLHRQVILQNTYGSLTRQLAQLHDDGMTDLIPQYRIQLAAISDQLLDLYNINKRVGTETGRGLNARKMMANEDFSLAQMELGKRAANDGRPLTDDERVQLQRLHDEIKGWQDKYDAHVQTAKEREADLQSKLEIERLKKEAKPIDPTIKRIADLVGQKLHTEADAARARIKARAFTFSAGLDPTVFADVAVIGAEHIFNGLHDFSEWSKKMVEDFTDKVQPHLDEIWKAANKKFDSIVDQTALDKARAATEAIKKLPVPEQIDRAVSQIGEKIKKGKKDEITTQVQRLARLIVQADPAIERDALIDRVHARLIEIDPNITRSEARDMISGYGDFKQLSKDQISIRLRDLKGQMQQVSKLKAMQEGQPPLKTGLERRVPSREESLLIRQVNDAKREFQVPITDPNTQLKSSLDTLKTRMQTRILDYDQKLHEGNFTTRPKREIKLDQEAFRLKNEAEKAKQRYLSGLRADKLKNRTATQKALDTMVKWSRGFLLSGPSTLAKLTSAAFWRFVSNPIESAAGSIIKRLPYAREIASRAPIEGAGVSLKTEAKAFTTGFMRGLQDAEETLRTGKSGLDRIYGSRQDSGIGELDDEQKSVVDFFGHIHGALKAPVKRVAFEKSMLQQAEFYASKGVDITDPMVQTRMTIEAYKRANRDIFMQPNRYADRLRRFINSLEEKDKTTAKTPATAKLAASGARILLPIVKVPTNIVGETLEYATGLVTGSTKTYQAFRAGVDTLKPEEADIIMRELKKGSIGGAVLLLGYFAPQVFGGFYQKGEKRKTSDVPYGGAKVGGRVLPRTVLHAPLIENAQIGATARRVADSKLRKKDKATQGITAGALAGALGLADDVPFISEMTEVTKLFNPNERQQFLADLAKSRLVPQMISQTAEYFDKDAGGKPIKRKPATILQGIESGIPGLRKNVPVAKRQ